MNAFTVYETFRKFGQMNKVVVFKKKNYQVFIEFEHTQDALDFKNSLHNKNYQGYFFLKIQFTLKKSLIIKNPSLMENDFQQNKFSRPPCQIDFTFNFTSNKININNTIFNHQQFQTNQFGDFNQTNQYKSQDNLGSQYKDLVL